MASKKVRGCQTRTSLWPRYTLGTSMMLVFDMLTRMRVYVISVFDASDGTGGQHPGNCRSNYILGKGQGYHRQQAGMTELRLH